MRLSTVRFKITCNRWQKNFKKSSKVPKNFPKLSSFYLKNIPIKLTSKHSIKPTSNIS